MLGAGITDFGLSFTEHFHMRLLMGLSGVDVHVHVHLLIFSLIL